MNLLTGMILCGGQSSRMGEDKCQLRYHGLPQWQYLAKLMSPFCKDILISCSPSQVVTFSFGLERASSQISVVPDAAAYAGHGPVSGLLSGWDKWTGSSFLVVGCDYPLLTVHSITQLVSGRKANQDAVCFQRKGFDEPLVAIYEATCESPIRKQLEDGMDSLRRVFKILSVGRLVPVEPAQLDSIDTPERRNAVQLLTRRA